MRAFALSTLTSLAFYLFQSVDWTVALDKYGFPTVVAVAMFVYFSRAIKGKESEVNIYRDAMLREQQTQTEFLERMLDESRKQTACQYKAEK